jgi:hypothetical protein
LPLLLYSQLNVIFTTAQKSKSKSTCAPAAYKNKEEKQHGLDSGLLIGEPLRFGSLKVRAPAILSGSLRLVMHGLGSSNV